MKYNPLNKIRKTGQWLIPYLPFVVLFLAIVVAAYHIKVYW
jgi:hypothetical protein